MTPEETRAAIGELRFMHELPQNLRRDINSILIGISERRAVQREGTWLHEHEHTKNKGYILLKGQVRIQKSDAPEAMCYAPELLGEMMQFNPLHERTATVSAVEDCIVLQFSWEDFWQRVRESCSEEDQQRIQTALEDLAWSHLTG